MGERRSYLGGGILLAVGVALGAVLAGGGRPTLLLAGAGDHADAAIVATGPVAIEVDAQKTPITKDAVYYLNYSRGRLLAALPSDIQTATSRQTLTDFAERDLVQDFQIQPRQRCHFTMTTGSTGARNGGVALLYVFETVSGQLGVYQLKQQYGAVTSVNSIASSTRPTLELVERRGPDPRLAQAGAPAMAVAGGR